MEISCLFFEYQILITYLCDKIEKFKLLDLHNLNKSRS